MKNLHKKSKDTRFCVINCLILGLAFVILARLFVMQIVDAKASKAIVDSRLKLSVPVKAARGEITDRYGRAFVTNRKGYFVLYEQRQEEKKAREEALLSAIQLLAASEQNKYQDQLPISVFAPFVYLEPKESVSKFLAENGFPMDVTAEELISALSERYQIETERSQQEKRLLCGVRFGMEQEDFSVVSPYTLAEDVSIETVTKLKERSEEFPAIRIDERPVREYLYPETASHILGRVGKISMDEYEQNRDKGYSRIDSIGKQGIEKAFEHILKGTDGTRSVEENVYGETLDLIQSKDAVSGNTVMLTLDLMLQQKTEQALKNAADRVAQNEKNGGAAVVLDVNSGEILAMASYPTYDISTFGQDYDSLLKHPGNPMFHRALSGLYAPGSAFKPISAIAALESGSISPEEKIETKGKYEYLDRTFQCNIFRTTGKTHGVINLREAMAVSCNYYFYELGRRTGIDAMQSWAAAFGLAEKTGVELAGEEATGSVASPENRSKRGGVWYPGDVLQAAIGQSDHLFTPIALANYAATLANGGTNYKTTILKGIKSQKDGRVTYGQGPTVNRTVRVSKETQRSIKEGMEAVTQKGGTAETAFASFPIPVAGKTGSAQAPGGTNGLFIGYAPAEKPQIAVCVVVENGGAGSLAASAAKDIFAAYFEKPQKEEAERTAPYSLLP